MAKKKSRTTQEPQPLSQLLSHLGLDETVHPIDYIIVGDGSGTTWNKEMGWASTLIDMLTFDRMVFHGGSSHGTNIVAEMMAYIHPLLYLVGQKIRVRQGGTRVHIITDCQHLVTAWNQRTIRKKNRELWAMFDMIQRRGLKLHFHWVPRATWDLNKFADSLAGRSRIGQQKLLKRTLEKLGRSSIHEINPDDD